MPGDYVFIVTEYGIDYEYLHGVYTEQWAQVIATSLEFAGLNESGDTAHFYLKGTSQQVEIRRVMLDA